MSDRTKRRPELAASPAIEPLISRATICDRWDLCPHTLRRWELAGKLRPINFNSRLVRYRLAEIEQLLREAA